MYRVKKASDKIFKLLKKVMEIILYYMIEKLVKKENNINFKKSFSLISIFPICLATIGKKKFLAKVLISLLYIYKYFIFFFIKII
jgi:hypothetical protein